MPKVTKEDLAEAISKATGSSKKMAGECLNTILEEVAKALKGGKDVVLTGLGTFSVSKRKARMGRNPQTGASLKIPARKAVRFKVGKSLKDSVK